MARLICFPYFLWLCVYFYFSLHSESYVSLERGSSSTHPQQCTCTQMRTQMRTHMRTHTYSISSLHYGGYYNLCFSLFACLFASQPFPLVCKHHEGSLPYAQSAQQCLSGIRNTRIINTFSSEIRHRRAPQWAALAISVMVILSENKIFPAVCLYFFSRDGRYTLFLFWNGAKI